MAARPSTGVSIALIDHGRVLLTRREDFDIWCLPGGAVDENESSAEAARREMKEETGLSVTLTALVGVYSELNWFGSGLHVVHFAAAAVPQEMRLNVAEVLEARYFSQEELPEPLMAGHRRRILDALHGTAGSRVWKQEIPWPFEKEISRDEIYRLRDQSGLSRREFYIKHFGGPTRETLEVGSPTKDETP
jgi:ADP-ribose pyrophosphatase YjhB (NUDIX family)